MNVKDVAEVGAAVIISLGGGGALVLWFSNYLGKIWADRAIGWDKNRLRSQDLHALR